MKNLLTAFICLLLVLVCAFGVTACKHECEYADVITAPTCTEQGYTTHTCKCGNVIVDTYVNALGHDFGEYVSNLDADYDKDGTKTATCKRDGCSVTDTVTDEGTKKQSHIAFKTLSIEEKNIFSFDTEEFSFLEEIEIFGHSKYSVSKDKFGTETFLTKVVPLSCGDNDFYVFETIDDEVVNTFTVTLRRRPKYSVYFNTDGGTPIQSQTVEESFLSSMPTEITTKVGYTFDGWDFDFATPIMETTTIKSKWTANTDTAYKIEYYFENLGNGHYLDISNYSINSSLTENKSGTTDCKASTTVRQFDYFTFVENISNLSENINGDGSTVLKLYYTRNYYDVIVNKLNDKGTVSGAGSFANAETVKVTATVNAGYSFDGWYDGNKKVSEKLVYEFNPISDITLTAKWTANTDTPYTVEHYLQNLENDLFTIDNSLTEKNLGTTDTVVTAKAQQIEHFTHKVTTEESGNINGNGLTVLKVYYTRNYYTVTFDSDGGELYSGQEIQSIKYGGTVVAPVYEKSGYYVSSWDKSLTGISASITIKAIWTKVNVSEVVKRDGDYIYFGSYPQTIKEDSVTVSATANAYGYYLGSDGELYAKVVADPYREGYKFTNETEIIEGDTYYFKVEPIKWKVLSESSGKALVLCENIIESKRYDNNSNNYEESEIRAWLNREFYEKTFSMMERALINAVLVDNSAESTGYTDNEFACKDTLDKIFLLSYKEATNSAYGFVDYVSDEERERQTSDYARATYTLIDEYLPTEGYGYGLWWLRSPDNVYYDNVLNVYEDGYICSRIIFVDYNEIGVVPAMEIQIS